MGAQQDELERLRAALAVAEARAAEAARLQAVPSSTEAFIAALKLQIAQLRRELYGQRSERKARLLDQLELQLEEMEAAGRRRRDRSPEGGGQDDDRPGLRAPPAQA